MRAAHRLTAAAAGAVVLAATAAVITIDRTGAPTADEPISQARPELAPALDGDPEGEVDQPPQLSPDGRYVAYVVGAGRDWTLVADDTGAGGARLGEVPLPRRMMRPAPRAVAVTDEGLVVVGARGFQWLWRPLGDGAVLDLAQTAPGQVVVAGTDAGLIVNAGRYGQTDGAMGEPYLARVSGLGALTRLGPVPTHDALAAGDRWLAYAPPGTLGGEVPGIPELQVQRLDGSRRGVITAPDAWLFAPAILQWESADRLLVPLTSPDGRRALARCRLGAGACAVVDVPD